MNKVLIAIEESTLLGALNHLGVRCDWAKLISHIVDGRDVADVLLFAKLPPTKPEYVELREKRERFLHSVRTGMGFMVYERIGTTVPDSTYYRANIDVLMALKTLEMARAHPSCTVVLVTGSNDFGVLAQTLREEGHSIEVHFVDKFIGNELRMFSQSVNDITGFVTETFDKNAST